ncbi:TetR/AcrR family transcriptional regulator [Nonomuraea rhodomycinica]|uniref:TetR/AcrR family transcriptional regulator n=1 Tax=Nonomuraea rhodomycinica TaxID=1712872 RepID=A0A7Y6MCP6_9ACTN|nr:TetR/AcrR family transcriptional regulator [Nonomuraea rhodomycinica]NUW42140.1 TetR/AcrR family transcriptional regulator [Nonomuraea rhodomycinica]
MERLRDPRDRAERATRILDAAAGLLLRHGYRRVTIDDVAAGAEIGKGTVYLHWKTREQLFGAVFTREVCLAMDELRQALLDDPRTCLLHRFARVYFLAIARRPLLRGFVLADPELIGKLTATLDERHAAMAHGYFDLLVGHGLLSDDLGAEEAGFAYQATFEGFLRASDDERASDEEWERRADLLARTVRRAFENDAAPDDAVVREVADATAALLTKVIDADLADSGVTAE